MKQNWKLGETVFTSGIVNKNNQINYHFDTGNFTEVFSAMLAFKNDMVGGHLVLPQYDLALEIADGSLTLFDGQKALHGVTPIHYKSDRSYRFTMVYYSLKNMWHCLEIDDELARIRNVKTVREKKRIDKDHIAELSKHSGK